MSDQEKIVELAGKVMGWTRVEWAQDDGPDHPPYYWRKQDGCLLPMGWNPLASIGAAWMIVEQLNAMDKYVRVERTPAGKAVVAIWRHGVAITERADTAPRAICEAALKAIA
jgi:hypothetical protein